MNIEHLAWPAKSQVKKTLFLGMCSKSVWRTKIIDIDRIQKKVENRRKWRRKRKKKKKKRK